MNKPLTRREFLAASAAAGVGVLAAGRIQAAPFKTTLHKALIRGIPDEKALQGIKEAGFEGIECGAWSAKPADAQKARALAEKLHMRIHSVLRGWCDFNNPDKVEGDIASVRTALKAAQAFGADAILLVPCRAGRMAIPQAWEFDIAFDEKTGHVSRVVQGDNAKYKQYIDAQNQATDTSREAVKKLISAAEEAKVVVALENVWNNLWVRPQLMANFVGSFKSPWVKVYFDVGNHVNYAAVVRDDKVEIAYPPEAWIRALGPMLAKVHIKDYKLNADGKGGDWSKIREGSVNWPAVRQALEDVGYNGWLTDESGGLSVQELSKRFDLIIAGK